MLAQAANLAVLWSVLFGVALMTTPEGPAHGDALLRAATLSGLASLLCARLRLIHGRAWTVGAGPRLLYGARMLAAGFFAAWRLGLQLLLAPFGPRSTVLRAPWKASDPLRAEAAWALALQPGRLPTSLDAEGVYLHSLGRDAAAERAIAAARRPLAEAP